MFAKQSPNGPPAKDYLAAEERPAATGAAAKQSKGKTLSAADLGQAADSNSSQSVAQSTSKPNHGQQSIADHTGALAANESQSATATPTGMASKPQGRAQRSTGKSESARGKSEEQEPKRQTRPEKAGKDTVEAEKPQPKTCAQGGSAEGCSSILSEVF